MNKEQFMRNDQYNFIKRQVQQLVSGHGMVNDEQVLDALESLSIERVSDLFTDITDEQKEMLNKIVEIVDKVEAEQFLLNLESHIIPFNKPSEQKLKKLFPKAKKLKLPTEGLDYTKMTFLCFDDIGTKKRYLIAPTQKGITGLSGTYDGTNVKQICTICNQLTDVCMFMTKTKGDGIGMYTKKGNYICRDAADCNQQIMTLDKLYKFVENVR